jgi:hypothetical protein
MPGGGPLPKIPCPSCGEPNFDTDIVCWKCAEPLRAEPAPVHIRPTSGRQMDIKVGAMDSSSGPGDPDDVPPEVMQKVRSVRLDPRYGGTTATRVILVIILIVSSILFPGRHGRYGWYRWGRTVSYDPTATVSEYCKTMASNPSGDLGRAARLCTTDLAIRSKTDRKLQDALRLKNPLLPDDVLKQIGKNRLPLFSEPRMDGTSATVRVMIPGFMTSHGGSGGAQAPNLEVDFELWHDDRWLISDVPTVRNFTK